MRPMPHSEYIKTQDGAQCAVLFIHGILSTPRYFDHFLSAVPEGWDIYNILLDGHGGTVGDFSRTSMEKWQAQTAARLEELCLHYNKVVVAAHSLGTLLAINEVPRHPKVAALLLLDVPLVVRVKPTMMAQSLKAAFGKLDDSDPWEGALSQMVSITLTRRLWQYLGWVPRFWELLTLCRQTRDRVGAVTVPCHVFHARQDELVSMQSARYFQDRPNVTHEVLEHSGHNYISPEDGEKIKTALRRLIKGSLRVTGM